MTTTDIVLEKNTLIKGVWSLRVDVDGSHFAAVWSISMSGEAKDTGVRLSHWKKFDYAKKIDFCKSPKPYRFLSGEELRLVMLHGGLKDHNKWYVLLPPTAGMQGIQSWIDDIEAKASKVEEEGRRLLDNQPDGKPNPIRRGRNKLLRGQKIREGLDILKRCVPELVVA